MTQIAIFVGTRPEIIKMAPVLAAADGQGLDYIFIHCGQHYDYAMSQQFIDELGLPKPDFSFVVRERLPTRQIGRMVLAAEKALRESHPDLALVQGDTNSTLASALASNKLNIPLGHVEAGCRSFDLRMPEEHNRRLVDHLSALLFAPTEVNRHNLRRESVWGRIYVTGNTAIDACSRFLPQAEKKSRILGDVRFDDFCLATIHRAESVDNPRTLSGIIGALVGSRIPMVFPVHPRTRRSLRSAGLWNRLVETETVQLLPPVGYFDMLVLMKHCSFIATDSGGLQQEATAPPIRKRVVVLRKKTEMPEAVNAGFATLAGTSMKSVLDEILSASRASETLPRTSPYGDGKTGTRICEIVSHLY